MSVRKEFSPFAGVQTFLGREHRRALVGDEDVLVLGLPCDSATSFMPGARYAPSVIRKFSMLLRFYSENEGIYDPDTGTVILKGRRIVDLGDLDLPFGDQKELNRRIYEKVKELASSPAFKLFLGGDHSITYPIVKAFRERFKDLAVVQLDAHLDLLDVYVGARYTHASPMRRIIDEAGLSPGNLVQAGLRGYLTSVSTADYARKQGQTIISSKEILELGQDTCVERIRQVVGSKPCYLTFDVDFLDPSFCPATGVPEAGGPGFHEAKKILDGLFSALSFVGMDVVEFCPLVAGFERTAMNVNNLILTCLSRVYAGLG